MKWHSNQRKAYHAIKGDFPEEVRPEVGLEKGLVPDSWARSRGLLRRGK